MRAATALGSVIPACPTGETHTKAGETAQALGQQAVCNGDDIQTLFTLKIYLFVIFCAWVLCLHMCISTTCVPGTCKGLKKVSDPQELDLQTVVSLCVDAGNGT